MYPFINVRGDVTFCSSSRVALRGSRFSWGGRASYLTLGRHTRSASAPTPMCLRQSKMISLSSSKKALPCLPMSSTTSEQTVSSMSSSRPEKAMRTVRSRAVCSIFVIRLPMSLFLRSMQKAGATVGFSAVSRVRAKRPFSL